MQPTTARRLAMGLASGLAVAAVVELTRPRGGPARLVDWDEIGRHARRRAGAERLPAAVRARLEARYSELAAEMQGPLFTALESDPLAMPRFQALGRAEWIDVNLEILKRVIEPMLERARIPESRLVQAGRAGIDRYTGLVLGFLASRVLGQFDPQLMGHEPVQPSLYLVEPNVAEFEREAGLDSDDLRRWLILHECTHAWQFAAHPWLVGFMNEAIAELMALSDNRRASPVHRILSLTVGAPAQWATLRRVQAAMTLIEGYSNLVMNLAGRSHIATFDALEAAHRRRSGEKSALEVLFWKLTGLDLKLQQYERGEAFSRAVYDRHGMAVLNLAWESESNLPTLPEIEEPEAWIRRVVRRAGAGGARGSN